MIIRTSRPVARSLLFGGALFGIVLLSSTFPDRPIALETVTSVAACVLGRAEPRGAETPPAPALSSCSESLGHARLIEAAWMAEC